MGNQLLIRAYEVEVGDCIHVHIPEAIDTNNGKDEFNILIDCGTKGKKGLMKKAISHLESVLPDSDRGGGRKRLDLIVVSHEHQDHIKGFDPEYFKNIDIGSIWMSAAMDPDHPQAEKTNNLRSFAAKAMKALAADGLSLHPALQGLVGQYGVSNDKAMEALRTTWPRDHGIEARYVHAGMTGEDLGLSLNDTTIKILGPDEDIDRFYLGEVAPQDLHGLQSIGGMFQPPADYTGARPKNISHSDFERLRSRMLSNALAFAELDSKIKNNTSTILLIEWKGKRLLFVGDLEWEDEFREGIHNGGWNVAWHKRKGALNAPVDFLKVGHHGSTNATPWDEGGESSDTEPGDILDAILPKAGAGEPSKAQVVVSTMRKNYETIPKSALLVEIGKRVANTRNYEDDLGDAGVDLEELPDYEEFEEKWLAKPQPLRTDFEGLLHDEPGTTIRIDPA